MPFTKVPHFVLPLDLSRLQCPQLKLVPFESDIEKFSKLYFESTRNQDAVWSYLPYGPFEDLEACQRLQTDLIRPTENCTWMAIMLSKGTISKRDDTAEGGVRRFEIEDDTFAGSTGLLNVDIKQASAEIGFVTILPEFQRTFVGTLAHSLLLHHLLDPAPHDLGLRRVQWRANEQNAASVGAAKRLGFHFEGVSRYAVVLSAWKPSAQSGKGEEIDALLPTQGPDGVTWANARHTAVLSLCWDDWVAGGREHVDNLLLKYDV